MLVYCTMPAITNVHIAIGCDRQAEEYYGRDKLHRWMRRCFPDVPYEVERSVYPAGTVYFRALENTPA